MLPLQVKMDLGAMAKKRHSAFPKSPLLLEPHHQIVYCHIQNTRRGWVLPLCKDAVGVFYSTSRLSNSISVWLVDYHKESTDQRYAWAVGLKNVNNQMGWLYDIISSSLHMFIILINRFLEYSSGEIWLFMRVSSFKSRIDITETIWVRFQKYVE